MSYLAKKEDMKSLVYEALVCHIGCDIEIGSVEEENDNGESVLRVKGTTCYGIDFDYTINILATDTDEIEFDFSE